MTPRPGPLRKLFEPPGVDYDRPRTSRTLAGLGGGFLQIGHAGRFVAPPAGARGSGLANRQHLPFCRTFRTRARLGGRRTPTPLRENRMPNHEPQPSLFPHKMAKPQNPEDVRKRKNRLKF